MTGAVQSTNGKNPDFFFTVAVFPVHSEHCVLYVFSHTTEIMFHRVTSGGNVYKGSRG